jgi:DNA transformation protein and related proteins
MARPQIKFRSLRVTPEFRDFVLDQLARIPDLRAKAMFGGVGLYSADAFFGIVAADELFFKVDDSNRGAYEAVGSEPFRPVLARPVSMSYWRVPIEVIEDTAELATWGLAAIRAARNAATKPNAKKKARKRKPRKAASKKRRR